jgi:hypothetical protein
MTTRKSFNVASLCLAAFFLFGLAMSSQAAWTTIHNDFFNIDQNGDPVHTRSGCLRKFGDTYYWYGSQNFRDQLCYSSKDLMHWTAKGSLYRSTGSTNRMDVVYNDSTKQYVMIMKLNDSSAAGAHLGIATSSTPDGKFELKVDEKVFGYKIGDMSVYQDDDGKAYLLYVWDSIPGANSGGVSQHALGLMTPDYMGMSKRLWLWNTSSREGPCLMKHNGLYYYVTSLTLWTQSTASQFYTAPSLAGPWTTRLTPVITPGSTVSWDTQSDFIYTFKGTAGSVYMYGGDRWEKPNELRQGDYAWLPITFTPKDTLMMNYYQDWELEMDQGTWRPFDYNRNLAKRKTATASSVTGSNVANNVTDSTTYSNFTSTRWKSEASDSQWVQVDLGSALSLNRVILKWDTCYAKAFQIQVSSDASTWADVFSTKAGGKRSVTDETFPKTTARYVRMLATQRGLTNQGYSLFDFMVLNDSVSTVSTNPVNHSFQPYLASISCQNKVIHFYVPSNESIKLDIVNAKGKRVAVLAEGFRQAGQYQVALPPNLDHGVYLIRLTAQSKKLANLHLAL